VTAPTILQVPASAVLQQVHEDLGLDAERRDAQALIAEVMRGIAGSMCPCPAHALRSATERALSPLEVLERLQDQVSDTFEDLVAVGDFLELADVLIDGAEAKPRWMFCAPPSFIKRDSGHVYIVGVAPDDAVFLPSALRTRLHRRGALRYFEDPDGACLKELRDLGLREIRSNDWLVKQRAMSPEVFTAQYSQHLVTAGINGSLENAVILAGQSNGKTYRDRWVEPTNETGVFILRVPQLYGEPVWYYSRLKSGAVERSLLLPAIDHKERACDAAWRLQLAMDAQTGRPNSYKVQAAEGGYLLTFSFPLPLQARRRLTIIGSRQAQPGYVTTFWIPESELSQEQRFLRESFWLYAED
jgi:hypothetical protein